MLELHLQKNCFQCLLSVTVVYTEQSMYGKSVRARMAYEPYPGHTSMEFETGHWHTTVICNPSTWELKMCIVGMQDFFVT